MMSKRPEKDTKNPPGQIKYDWVKEEKKLNREPKITIPPGMDKLTPKKLTFDEWFANRFSNPDDICYDWCKECWKAAQDNK